jgi:cell division protease FtsH
MNYLPLFLLFQISSAFVNFGFMHSTDKNFFSGTNNKLENKKYPISKGKNHYIQNSNHNETVNDTNQPSIYAKRFPLSKKYYEESLKRLNSRNYSIRESEMLNSDNRDDDDEPEIFTLEDLFNQTEERPVARGRPGQPGIRIIINKGAFNSMSNQFNNMFNGGQEADDDDEEEPDPFSRRFSQNRDRKSENFEVITKAPLKFKDIGGYEKIKFELKQCIDILSNYTKYANYSVRVPKGLILEGPPGNGKTLLAKGLAGEAKIGFIAVSGSEFQEKYVGVGSSRVRELFNLAKKNVPCIVFIDEIDAIGRRRSGDGETSSSERDNTLNELLVALDGFKNSSGVFLIGATNRADLLDPALTRPGRIDKRIFIGPPDSTTREAIINIHTKGKPYDSTVDVKDLVDLTLGLSGAQIENLLNEAMLNALRHDRTEMTHQDIDQILNRIMAGWQPTEHQFTSDIIDHIAVHEMGHAVVGLLCKHHSKMTKVIINLSSPKSPAYTVFEGSTSTIYTKQALFEHLMILLAGRIAEEVFYDVTVTTGAINDFEEAFKLAEKMIVYYGMGKKVIYPSSSEKYKEMIDNEVVGLINDAYGYAEFIVQNAKDLILDGAEILKRDKLLKAETLVTMIEEKYPSILNLKVKQ